MRKRQVPPHPRSRSSARSSCSSSSARYLSYSRSDSRILVPLLAYAVACAALWAGSWAALRQGSDLTRVGPLRAARTRPGGGVGFYVFRMLFVLNEDHDVLPEMAARGALAPPFANAGSPTSSPTTASTGIRPAWPAPRSASGLHRSRLHAPRASGLPERRLPPDVPSRTEQHLRGTGQHVVRLTPSSLSPRARCEPRSAETTAGACAGDSSGEPRWSPDDATIRRVDESSDDSMRLRGSRPSLAIRRGSGPIASPRER